MEKTMETRIYLNGGYRNIKPTDKVKSMRAAAAFCAYNCLHPLVKLNGGYYRINNEGNYVFLFRTLDMTFADLFRTLQ